MVNLEKENLEEKNESKTNNGNIEECFLPTMSILMIAIPIFLLVVGGLFSMSGLGDMLFSLLNGINKTNGGFPQSAVVAEEEENKKIFYLTVSGKSQNNVSELYIMEFSDDNGTARSFFVSKELFENYEIGSQVNIIVDYQAEAFTLDDEKIKEVKIE